MNKGKKDGTVVQIKGRYYARWTVEGKRVYGNPHETFDQADKERLEKRPAESPTVAKTDIPSLGDWAVTNLQGNYGKRIAKTTFDTNEAIRLAHLEKSSLSNIKLHRITRAHCQAFIDQLVNQRTKSRVSPSYEQRVGAFLSKLFSLAVDEGIIRDNPMKRVSFRPIEERENRTLSPDEGIRLLNPSTMADAVMLVALHTGMRRAELCRLEWKHVLKTTIKVPGTKNAYSKATIPLTPEAKEAIENQPRRSSFVFTNKSGMPVQPRRMTKIVKDRMAEIGIPPETRLHDLRGSFISLLIEQGADIRTVMELGRHGDIRTTTKAYARARSEVKENAIERLRDAIGSEAKTAKG